MSFAQNREVRKGERRNRVGHSEDIARRNRITLSSRGFIRGSEERNARLTLGAPGPLEAQSTRIIVLKGKYASIHPVLIRRSLQIALFYNTSRGGGQRHGRRIEIQRAPAKAFRYKRIQ